MTIDAYYFEDLSLGMRASYARTVTIEDIEAYAELSGDDNPVHLDEEFAASTQFQGCIVHGMLSAGFISKVLGTQMPGHGSIYLSQTLRFRASVRPGDTVDAQARITALDEERRRVTLECIWKVGETIVIEGEALVLVPARGAA